MRILIIIFLLGLTSKAFSQTGKLFVGTLNNSIKITLYLQELDEGTNADAIIGAYKYNDKNGYLLLNGYRNTNGNIILVEQATPNFSGIFFGLLSGNQISGKWTSANQMSSYPFKITMTKAKNEQLKLFQDAIAVKAQEFRNY